MSELKAYNINDLSLHDIVNCEFYLKSEADKVIADKDAEIAQLQAILESRDKQVWALKHRIAPKQSDKTLQERLNEVCEKHGVSTLQDLDWAFCESEKRRTKDIIDAVNIIYHQKYKRCLAMAMWCSAELGMLISTWESKIKHYKKWQKRWLELAERLKEAK